jgi:hypothetical protein
MRKLALTAAAAASILVGGSLVAGPAAAITISPAGVRDAVDALGTVEKTTSCWRHGFFGWGWYPCGYYYGPGYGYYGPSFRFGFFGHRRHFGHRHYGYRHYGHRRHYGGHRRF